MKVLVQKFGGTSLSTVQRIRKAAEIIASALDSGYRVIAVASAMGNTTDELLALSRDFNAAYSARDLDLLLSTGEQVSASLLSLALNSMGRKARAFTGAQAGIVTDRVHGSARIKKIHTKYLVNSLRANEVTVVTGYQGISDQGEVTTLGRGGSDTTAVALAAALRAERCEIYTDVDGVFSADPGLHKSPSKLSHLSYEQMLVLANAGAQVMCPQSMEITRKTNTLVQVRSAFNLEDKGTTIGGAQYTLQFCGLACEKEEIFAIGPTESLTDLQPIAFLLREIRQTGAQCEIVRPLSKTQKNCVFLSINKRHVHDSDALIEKLARQLNLDVCHKHRLTKLSLVGNFENKRETLLKSLNVLLPARIRPMFWSSEANARISFLPARTPRATALELLHAEFWQAEKQAQASFATA